MRCLACGGALMLAIVLAGCGPKDSTVVPTAKKHDHSGWWCEEHGIPEHECSMCQEKVEKECKAKGDWCELHARAKTQCFKCDPSLKERFAAKYRTKYGEEPPPITEEEDEKKSKGGKP